MPVNIDTNTTSNDTERCYDRNLSINKIIEVVTEILHPLQICASLQFTLVEHVKRIESHLFAMADTEIEYFRLVSEKIASIQTEVEEICKQLKEQLTRNANSTRTSTPRNIPGWRDFYSLSLRNAVINAFIEDVRAKVKIPLQHTLGLRIGVEEIENHTFKTATSKSDYFSILERKKIEITSQLDAYFKEE